MLRSGWERKQASALHVVVQGRLDQLVRIAVLEQIDDGETSAERGGAGGEGVMASVRCQWLVGQDSAGRACLPAAAGGVRPATLGRPRLAPWAPGLDNIEKSNSLAGGGSLSR